VVAAIEAVGERFVCRQPKRIPASFEQLHSHGTTRRDRPWWTDLTGLQPYHRQFENEAWTGAR
jgi:hypothetical protein